MLARDILIQAYPEELADNLLGSFKSIEENYVLQKWKPSELDAGHFVETVRRILEFEFTGKYAPFNQQLTSFNDSALKQYEQSQGDESLRILIPRILIAIYGIRNKRGVGHVSTVSPNEMDATLILYNVKWVLAELIRLKSKMSIDETQAVVDSIVERQVEILWKTDEFTRVLDGNLSARDKVLILLYNADNQQDADLQKIIEYQNVTDFKKILKKLHSQNLI
ncbi:MAG: hypothetical protein AB1564_02565, partial [Chloroflexota bacterium]